MEEKIGKEIRFVGIVLCVIVATMMFSMCNGLSQINTSISGLNFNTDKKHAPKIYLDDVEEKLENISDNLGDIVKGLNGPFGFEAGDPSLNSHMNSIAYRINHSSHQLGSINDNLVKIRKELRRIRMKEGSKE
jgi:hypothetical protein